MVHMMFQSVSKGTNFFPVFVAFKNLRRGKCFETCVEVTHVSKRPKIFSDFPIKTMPVTIRISVLVSSLSGEGVV